MTDVRAGLSPGSVFGGYRVDAFVARGGMGVVYRATQLALDRTVALKVVAPEIADDPAFRDRFEREARLAASLNHPNILPIYEAGEIDGQLFLSMRFVEGTDLGRLIAQGRLDPPRAAALIAQVASALDAAHSRGLIHRDVKPGNVLIAQEYGQERAYLADFGLSKSLAAATRLTRTGFMVGTLDYVAPEQVQGGTVDGRVDTYALACVLFEAVTGQIPFDRADDAAKVWAHLSEPPPSAAAIAPAVTNELDEVIRRGMAKRPEDRFAESGDFGRTAVAAAGEDSRSARTEVDRVIVPPGVVPLAGPPPAAAATPAAATPAPPATPGVAAPAAPRATPPADQPAAKRTGPGRRTALWAGAAAAVLIVGVIVAIAIGSSGSAGGSTTTTTITSSSTTTQPTTTSSTTTISPEQAQTAVYHARVSRIASRIKAVFRQFPNGHNFGKASFNATSLRVAAGLRGIADNLDALSPPSKALVAHEALVNDLRAMEQSFRSLALDSQTRNFASARRDLNRASAALTSINRLVKRVLAQTNT
jgi:predicted Ser/Thr protein kinase